jgi:hypothetical protein
MISPEQALWIAVLGRLLADATTPGDKLDQHQARRVLHRGNRDLNLICALAGVEPDALMDQYERMTRKFSAPTHLTQRSRPKNEVSTA